MTTAAETPPPARKKTRFLQRWAFWIIGGVVVIGFVNAKSIKPFLSLALDGDLTTSAPVPPKQYIKSDLKFANTALEEFFDRYDEAVRTQEPLVYEQEREPNQHVVIAKHVRYPIRMRLLTRQNSQEETEVYEIQALSFVNEVVFVELDLYGTQQANLKVVFGHYNDFRGAHVSTCYCYPRKKVWNWLHYANQGLVYYVPYEHDNPSQPFVELFDSPERFLAIALEEEEAIRKSAAATFQAGTLFDREVLKNGRLGLFSFSKPEQDELLQMVMQELEQRRSHLSNNYREMHAQLRDAFPLWETLLKVYGAENKAKEE